jgi:hypothetical protein
MLTSSAKAMNSSVFVYISNNSSNQTFATIYEFLRAYGSNQTIELLNITLFLFTSCLGTILNAISISVFFKKEFSIPLYSYLRVYVVTGLLVSILQVTYPFFNCKTLFFETSNSYAGVYYVTFVYGFVQATLLCFVFMIDLVIVIDRIATFNVRFKLLFNRLHSIQIIGVLFISSVIIMLPHRFSTGIVEHRLHDTKLDKTINIYFITVKTSFTEHFAGKLILNIIYIFRNGVTLVLDMSLNIISIYYFREFSLKRKNFVSVSRLSSGVFNSTNAGRTFRSEKMIVLMVITLSAISIVHKVQMNITFLYHLLGQNTKTVTILYFLTNWFNSLRNVASFFIFYTFNRKFKRVLHGYMTNLRSCSSSNEKIL